MKRIFGSFFDIRKGEKLQTLLMFVTHYLLMVTYYLLKPARDSLFLVKVDPLQLPLVFIITAVMTVPVMQLYIRASRSLKFNYLIATTFGILIVNLLLLRWLIQWDHPWIYYLFYSWVSIYGALSISQFWLLGNTVFDSAQAKRIFALLGLSGIFGAFTGGEVTSLCVEKLGISTPNLLVFCMVILLVIIILVNVIWNRHKLEEMEHTRPYRRKQERKEKLGRLFGEVKRSRFLLFIVAAVALTVMVTSFVDYQFKVISKETFPTTKELTSFLGKFYGRLSLVSLLLQLLFTYRFLRTLGVAGVILFLPLGLMAGSVTMFIFPGLVAAVLLRGTDGSLRYSLDKTGRELLFLPIPLETKKRIKVLVDMFVDRWFRGIAGGLLLLCTLVFQLSIREISLVILGLLTVWLILAIMMRREYVNAFRLALERRDIDPDQSPERITDAQTISTLISSVKSGDERQISYALDMLSSVKSQKLIEPVRALLEHSSADIRRKAVQLLHDQGDSELIGEMQQRLHDPDPDVRIAAIYFLCDHGGRERSEFLDELLSNDDIRIRAAAVGCIAEFGSTTDQSLINEDVAQGLLQYDGAEYVSCRIQLARALGRIQHFRLNEYLAMLMNDPSPAVIQQTIESLGRLHRPEYVPWLVEQLGNKRFRAPARDALSSYGTELLPTLSGYLNDDNIPLVIRTNIPRVMRQVRNQKAADLLMENLDRVDPYLRYHVVKALNKIRASRPDVEFDKLRLEAALLNEAKSYFEAFRILIMHRHSDQASGRLLARALIEKQNMNIEQIFRLLGLFYPPDDMYAAYAGVTSNKRILRASAMEFLDNVLKADVKKYVVPILDDSITESFVSRRLDLFGIEFESHEDALVHLMGGRDRWLRACAVFHRMHYRGTKSEEMVSKAIEDPDPVVRETARLVISRMDLTEPEEDFKMLTTIEKVIFLQNIDIFSEVPSEYLAHLAAIANEVVYEEGEVIFREQEPPDALYLILSGKVRLHRGQKEIMVATAKDAFGTWALFDNERRVATAIALEETRLLRVDREDFSDLLADHVQITQGVLRAMAGRLRNLLARIDTGQESMES